MSENKDIYKKYFIKSIAISSISGLLILFVYWLAVHFVRPYVFSHEKVCTKYLECDQKFAYPYGKLHCFRASDNALSPAGDIVLWSQMKHKNFKIDKESITDVFFENCKTGKDALFNKHPCEELLIITKPESETKANEDKEVYRVFAHMDKYKSYKNFYADERQCDENKPGLNLLINKPESEESLSYTKTKYENIRDTCSGFSIYPLAQMPIVATMAKKLSSLFYNAGLYLVIFGALAMVVWLLDRTLGRYVLKEPYKKIRDKVLGLLENVWKGNDPIDNQLAKKIVGVAAPLALTIGISLTIHQTIVIKGDIDRTEQKSALSKHKIELIVNMATEIEGNSPENVCDRVADCDEEGVGIMDLQELVNKRKELLTRLKDALGTDFETENVLIYELALLNRQIKGKSASLEIDLGGSVDIGLNLEELKKLNEIFDAINKNQLKIDQSILTTSQAMSEISELLKAQNEFNAGIKEHNKTTDGIFKKMKESDEKHSINSHVNERSKSTLVAPASYYENRILYTLAVSIDKNEKDMANSMLDRINNIKQHKIYVNINEHGYAQKENLLWLALRSGYSHNNDYTIAEKICKKMVGDPQYKKRQKEEFINQGFKGFKDNKEDKVSIDGKYECLNKY